MSVGTGVGLGMGTAITLLWRRAQNQRPARGSASAGVDPPSLADKPQPAKPKAAPQRTVAKTSTIAEVLDLPATVDLPTAASALGFGRSKAYALARAGAFPCRVVSAGETVRVPTAELLNLLGIDLHAAVSAHERPKRPRGGGRS